MEPYQKVAPGDVLPGLPWRPWNDMLDVIWAAKRGQLDQLAEAGFGSLRSGVAAIRNDTGTDLERFSVLGITGFAIDPSTNLQAFKNRPALTGDVPVVSNFERFVVTQQPCRADAYCDGLLLGITPAQIYVNDEGDDYADLSPGDVTQLQSGPAGSCWIAYKQPGAGLLWGLVVLGVQGSQFAFGKTAEAINKDDSGSVNLYRGIVAGEEYWDGVSTFTAYNHFADLDSDKFCLCVYLQRNWRIVVAEC